MALRRIHRNSTRTKLQWATHPLAGTCSQSAAALVAQRSSAARAKHVKHTHVTARISRHHRAHDEGRALRARVAYDGTHFNGWQHQPNAMTAEAN